MYFDDTFEDMDKLKFSFRLYDVDNNGVVDMEEVTAIIETLDSIEGVKPGPKQILYILNLHLLRLRNYPHIWSFFYDTFHIHASLFHCTYNL